MCKIITVLLFILAGCSASKRDNIVQENPPNIVLFLVDDMGWQDTSVPFWEKRTPLNDTYYTPNMERLANQGMKFTQAYASPICSPSRISLMTGTNPARHRVTNWTLEYNKPTDEFDSQLAYPSWNFNGLSNTVNIPNAFYAKPLSELLQQASYFTIHIGKAHFGAMSTPYSNPINMGFDVNISGHASGGIQSYEGRDNFGNIPQQTSYNAVPDLDEFYGRDIFITEALTQKAIKELDKRPKNKPFFLYLSHYAVHIPIMGDRRFLQKYIDKGMNEIEAKYATLIEGMDKSLGDIMNYLEYHKLDNTIFIFMSDNGGLDVYSRGLPQNTCNAPLSSGKGSLLEGGIRVPMIVAWKGKIREATVNNQLVGIEDVFPTLLEISGLKKYEIPQQIDGKSFASSFLDKKDGETTTTTEKTLIWHLPNKWFSTHQELGISPASAIRKGDYKLIYYHNTQHVKLFNLADDISETNDISAENSSKVEELSKELSEYLRSVEAQMPFDKKKGKVVPFPDEL